MKNMILLDIETGDFNLDSGIYEVALLVIEDGKIVLSEHIAEMEDEASIHLGMGAGYTDISENSLKKEQFRKIINTYNYPVVAHNVPFDRKFLVHYGWLDEDYECYDSIRAIKYANPNLFSYSLGYLLSFYNINRSLTHIAIDDVKALYKVILKVNPTIWIPLYKVPPKKFKNFVKVTANVEGQSTLFQNKRIVFTGASPFPRILMKEIATKCGAIATGSVSSRTDLLICGEKPGSKLAKAKELGIEVQTDEWFIDAVSKDFKLDSATITRQSIAAATESDTKEKSIFKKIPELKGKVVNIALLPLSIQRKIEDILVNHMEVAGLNKGSNGYKVDVIVYADDGDYALLKKAEELHITTIPLSKFNQMILN
ncbi:BRCA1 C Terminus (BRCT) domain-containing protein [Evansella caseinilytica]|uniref:BRCA1 C Terminus (BRCT) domain-containing protein n=1 Tax=Evansella caseinilytica TaxID=1503961 RepID=A0A1H3V1Q8_9BACI|nr:BRCA1 C Terminus (BRCT) domain-containing protein [Evansella caseinilytica]